MNTLTRLRTNGRRTHWVRRAIAVLSACAFLNGCTTTFTRSAPPPSSSVVLLQRGDEVTCYLKDGTRRELTVTADDGAYVHGAHEEIAWKDISSVQVKRLSVLKTAGLVLGVVVIGAVIYAASQGFAFMPSGGPWAAP